jgi:hypothetical protein
MAEGLVGNVGEDEGKNAQGHQGKSVVLRLGLHGH